MFWVDLIFEWYEDAMVFRVFIFIFCFEPSLGKDISMRATSTTVMVIFLKVPFQTLFDHNFIQSSFSTVARCIDRNILKATLQLKILRKWTKIRADCFIKIWVNIIERKSTKVPWKLPLAKNTTPHVKENCTTYCYMLLFLSSKPNF